MITPHACLNELPLHAIKPDGWLRGFLETQRDGLTGHPEHAGYPFSTQGWAADIVPPRDGPCSPWWPYEQTAYWIDGALRCGHLLGDAALVARARTHLDYVIARQEADGYLGPRHLKTGEWNSLWAHAVLLRAFMAEHSATGDARVLAAMERFADFAVKRLTSGQASGNAIATDVFCLGDRDLVNVEHALYTARAAGNQALADRALAALRSAATLAQLAPGGVPSGHAITYTERLKLPILAYMQTGDREWLDAVRNEYRALDEYHMLIDGLPSASEELLGRQSNAVHETCLVSDYTWTTGYMLLATGEAAWADRIEQACFNAGMGCVTKDFKAHQYYSGPNQVVAAANTSHWNADTGWYPQSMPRLAFQPGHDTECCTGNVNRFMPNYCARMWLRAPNGGVAAALYGPSILSTTVGSQATPVTIHQVTDYPFGETVTLRIAAPAPVRFPLVLRIPGWCERAELRVQGRPVNQSLQPGAFVTLDREFAPGDVVTLSLPMTPRLTALPWDGIAVVRGPLTYSFRVPETLTRRTLLNRSSEAFPIFDRTPAGFWAYGLDLPVEDAARHIHVTCGPVPANPWDPETTPVRLTPLDETAAMERHHHVVLVLSMLTDRERKVLTMRLGLEDGEVHTLEEVGKHFKVTRERIRQVEAKGLRKLRHLLRLRLLEEYLATSPKSPGAPLCEHDFADQHDVVED